MPASYYFITIAWRFKGQIDYIYEDVVSSIHPVYYLIDSRRLLRDREIHIIYDIKITKEQYEELEHK